MSAGYMLAVVPLVSLTDRQPARRIYLASSALSALSCFGVALCDSLLPALGFRAVAGIALAGMYMPGLQALTHGVEGTRRSRIAAWYTSSFTTGASLSFLLGRVGTLLGWRSAFVLAGILSTAARLPSGFGKPRRPRPDLWVCRGNLGFGRIAAVDHCFSRVLCRGSDRCSRASLDRAGGRCADQFSRRPRRSSRQRAVDPLRPAPHCFRYLL